MNKKLHIEEHADASIKQGCWSEALAFMDSDISWKACLYGLSETTYSFAVRSLVDSLPTNSNLALWKKLVSPQCGACGSSKQTLLHVLNNCSVKMPLYSWRHDNILLRIRNFVQSKLPEHEVYCDICVDGYSFKDIKVHTIPEDIYQTNLRPDLVVVDRVKKILNIIELTVPFESNILKAQEYKSNKYASLIAGVIESGFSCFFHSLEVGSRGIVSHGASQLFRSVCKASRQETKVLLKSLSHDSLKCSYLIFREKDNSSAIFTSILHSS